MTLLIPEPFLVRNVDTNLTGLIHVLLWEEGYVTRERLLMCLMCPPGNYGGGGLGVGVVDAPYDDDDDDASEGLKRVWEG